jgi:hypothetical protein
VRNDKNVQRETKGEKIVKKGVNVYTLTRTERFEITDVNELNDMLNTIQRELSNTTYNIEQLTSIKLRLENEIAEIQSLITLAEKDNK